MSGTKALWLYTSMNFLNAVVDELDDVLLLLQVGDEPQGVGHVVAGSQRRGVRFEDPRVLLPATCLDTASTLFASRQSYYATSRTASFLFGLVPFRHPPNKIFDRKETAVGARPRQSR